MSGPTVTFGARDDSINSPTPFMLDTEAAHYIKRRLSASQKLNISDNCPGIDGSAMNRDAIYCTNTQLAISAASASLAYNQSIPAGLLGNSNMQGVRHQRCL